MTLGHVIIGRDRWSLDFCRDHEQAHVRQVERWGIAFIPAYLLASLLAWGAANITIATTGSNATPAGHAANRIDSH